MSETRGLGRIGRREKDDQTEGEDSLAPFPSGPILLTLLCYLAHVYPHTEINCL